MRNRWLAAALCAYRLALPGYHYEFPRDHFNHPEFQTEWWYYTGNVHTREGQRFGFELTFFRQGVAAPEQTSNQSPNVWDVQDVWMAHLALSDIDGGRFLHAERLNRAGAGLAGADEAQQRVWNGNWQARWGAGPRPAAASQAALLPKTAKDSQELMAIADRFSLKLSIRSAKAPVIHGSNGISRKGEGQGRASHYISLTRLITAGEIEMEGTRFQVEGLTWMDHEFFTEQLDPAQSGWDWFSLQLNDGSEIMLFRLRRKDGSADPHSAGTYVDAQGRSRFLAANEFSLEPGKTWTSPATHARYPIEWKIRIPALQVEAAIATRLPQQEIPGAGAAIPSYWEGAIDAIGIKQGGPLMGSGYLEMTGYAGPNPMNGFTTRTVP